MLRPDHDPKNPDTWPSAAPECGWMLGTLEIAPLLGVLERTPHMWKRRKRLPPPDYPAVNGTEAWECRTVLLWADETHRMTPKILDEDGNVDVEASELKAKQLATLFRNTFGTEPGEPRRPGVWPTREPREDEPITANGSLPSPTITATATIPPPPPPTTVLVEPRLKGEKAKRGRRFQKPAHT